MVGGACGGAGGDGTWRRPVASGGRQLTEGVAQVRGGASRISREADAGQRRLAVGLIVLVFFLARLTGDPADLYLPIDARRGAPAVRRAARLQRPVLVQFGRFLATRAVRLRRVAAPARPALDMVLEAFPTTLTLAASQ